MKKTEKEEYRDDLLGKNPHRRQKNYIADSRPPRTQDDDDSL